MTKRLIAAGVCAVALTAGCTAQHAATTSAPAPAVSSPAATSATPTRPSPSATPSATVTATSSPSGVTATASASAPVTWTMQNNARFGFVAPVPGGWGVDADAPNGDGFVATGPNGARVQYAGANLSGDPATTQPCKLARSTNADDGVTITYATETDTSCVISGTKGDRIVYERWWLGQASRVTMRWTYPAADKADVDPLVEYAGEHVQPGDLNAAH